MSWVTPITDRTQADIANKVSKAYLNFADLNRIEGNIEYVRSVLVSAGYYVPTMTIKTNWVETDMIYLIDLERIRSNISTIQSSWISITSIPSVLSPSYLKFNDAEQILLESKTAIDNMIAYYHFSGQLYSGGMIL